MVFCTLKRWILPSLVKIKVQWGTGTPQTNWMWRAGQKLRSVLMSGAVGDIPGSRQQASWTSWLRRMRILTMPAPSIPTSLAPSFSRNFGSIFHGKIWEDGRCFTWGNSRGMAPHVAECSFLGWFQRTVLRRFWCPTFGRWQDGTGMLVLSVFWLNFETQMPCKTGRQIVIYIYIIYNILIVIYIYM